MTNVQSKFFTPIYCSCTYFHHPWTESCANCTAGLLASSIPYCLRVYTAVYMAGLVMRGRIPKREDFKKTVLGILQSTGFLVTNAFTFGMYNCLLRYLLGAYYFLTIGFMPAFLASFTAIVVERPARRPMLALYVANLATESLWNLAESRGIVKSIPNGQAIVFGIGISILLYLYRLGLHKTQCKDSLFSIAKIIVGKDEEGPLPKTNERADNSPTTANRSRPLVNIWSVAGIVSIYGRLIDKLKSRHISCPHKNSCIKNAFMGGLIPFAGGLSVQVALKIIFNMKSIAKGKFNWQKNIFNNNILNLGIFLGGFPLLFKSVSCILRHSFGYDDPRFAIPAGFIGSIAFIKYPNVTVALYVLWKMLQLVYNLGIDHGVLPRVPGFILLLYSFCTGLLFHVGILEATSLRSSYFSFLQSISGGRLTRFNLEQFDVLGVGTSQKMSDVMQKLRIVNANNLPKYSMAFLD